jgi:F-type H+-transporting ATPase subunit delta
MASVATLRDLIEALIGSAEEGGDLDKVASDLEGFFQILSSQEEVRNILGSSVYGTDERKLIIGDIGDKFGFDKLTVNFLNLAIELGKFKGLIKFEELFTRKIRKAAGRVKAEVITAVNPSEMDLQRVKEALDRLLEKDVEVRLKVDPEILGGVIARIEDKVFDGSIKTQLERIRRVLSSA